jgi:hypothetical protein
MIEWNSFGVDLSVCVGVDVDVELTGLFPSSEALSLFHDCRLPLPLNLNLSLNLNFNFNVGMFDSCPWRLRLDVWCSMFDIRCSVFDGLIDCEWLGLVWGDLLQRREEWFE